MTLGGGGGMGGVIIGFLGISLIFSSSSRACSTFVNFGIGSLLRVASKGSFLGVVVGFSLIGVVVIGVSLIGVVVIGVSLIGVVVIGVYLIGVVVVGVYLIGVGVV